MPAWLAMGAAATGESPVSMRTRRPAWRSAATACSGIGAEGVAGIEVAGEGVVEGHPQPRDAGSGGGDSLRQRDEEFLEEGFIAEQAIVAFDFGGEAAAGKNLHVFGGLPGEADALRAIIDDGVGERMVGALLGCGGHAEQIVLRRGRPSG